MASNKIRRRRGGLDSETRELVDQVTLRNLDYTREFLRQNKTPRSGVRVKVRDKLLGLLEDKPDLKPDLRSLLNELDVWGNQRIRLRKLPPDLLRDFDSEDAVKRKIAAADMSELMNGEIPLTPPEVAIPCRISYEERQENRKTGRYLTLFAAKTRMVLIPATQVSELRPDDKPGIVFKPYKEERQRVVDFAEINLDTGFSVISTPLIRPGSVFNTEFDTLYGAFRPLMDLDAARPINLYKATENIGALPQDEVRLRAQKAKTKFGGSVDMSSHDSEADMRSDPELLRAEGTLPKDRRANCNCYWRPTVGLSVTVHTLINAPEGEVLIMGQVTGEHVRHVLRRILKANR